MPDGKKYTASSTNEGKKISLKPSNINSGTEITVQKLFYNLPARKKFLKSDNYEYRKLLSKERIFMIVDKPMTKILPELYEENNEIPNVYNNLLDSKKQTDVKKFRLKRSQTKQTKTA